MVIDTDMQASFGYWVRRRRKALDLTQRILADMVGCSLIMVKKIEIDERLPSQQMAERFADALHIPVQQRAAFLALARQRLAPAPSGLPLRSHNSAPPLIEDASMRPFFGREAEQHEILTRLSHPECRLLTLVGPGGIGKTRLALRIASLTSFAHGACIVSLGDITTPMLIVPTIAHTLGVQVADNDDIRQALIRFLGERELLLVLDDVEQLLQSETGEPGAFLALLTHLLISCRKVKFLVTSREQLNIQAEWVYRLSGLSAETDALALFVKCAQKRDPSFKSAGQEAAIKEICRLVEGIPLAVELAAGWVPTLSCEQIRERLQTGIDLLTTRLRDIPARHRSLRTLFDHSWDLWAEDERALLMKLSVFRGGFTSERCTAISGAGPEALRVLVEKSVVSVGHQGRYYLHELTRRYLADQLASSGKEAEVRHAHCSAYLTLAEGAASHLAGAAALAWLNKLDNECDNLRTALDWALLHADPITLCRLAAALTRYWYARGQWQEGIACLQAVQARTDGAILPERATCLCWCAFMLIRSGRSELARPYIVEGHALATLTQDKKALGWATLGMSYLVREGDEPLRACQKAIDYFRRAGDDEACAMALYFLGDELRIQGDLKPAQHAYNESWQVYRRLGNCIYGAYPLGNLGRIALLEGDLATAEQHFAACVEYSRENGNGISLVDWLVRLGTVALYKADTPAARTALHEAVTFAQRLAYQDSLPTIHLWQALLESLDGSQAQALTYLKESVNGYILDHSPNMPDSPGPPSPHHQPEMLDALIVAAHIFTSGKQYSQAASTLGCAAKLLHERGTRIDQPLQTLMQRSIDACQEALETGTYKLYWEMGMTDSGWTEQVETAVRLLLTGIQNHPPS
jgi:predicted ATPase/DNA-binding XRE family transcriptional regulator